MSLGEPAGGHWFSGMEKLIKRPTPKELKDKELLCKILKYENTKFMVVHKNSKVRSLV